MSEKETQTPDPAIGDRIAKARDSIGLTQEQVAQRLGFARTTQVAIEQGRRRVSAQELYVFSRVLGRPLDYFLGVGAWGDLDFRPLLRRFGELAEGEGGPTPESRALIEFEALCRDYLELETMNELPAKVLPDLGMPDLQGIGDAERLAGAVRGLLGVADEAPLRDLRDLLEETLAVRTFVLDRAGTLSGASIHHPNVGGCVLVTRNFVAHNRYTLAHELAHLLAHRDRDGHVDLAPAPGKKPPEERFADAFAAALLMPSRGVRERFTSVRQADQELSDVDLLYLARTFGVSVPAMAYRLQNLRLVAPSLRERLLAAHEASPVGPEQRARDAGIDGPYPDRHQWAALPERYVFLAMRAYRNERISTGRLAELLRLDRDAALEKFEQYVARDADSPEGAEDEP